MTERKECAYCGQPNPETSDHLPPKSFFPPPRPGNLITVPCCESCRDGQSKDDETVRVLLSLHDKSGNHPAIAKLDPLRALRRLRAWRYARYLKGLIHTAPVQTPLGMIVPKSEVLIETEPMTRWLTRLTRGLHFHHVGERLPLEWTVYPLVEPMFTWPLSNGIVAKLRAELPVEIGDGVFSYRFLIGLGQNTGWLFKFYDGVEFVTVATHPDKPSGPPTRWIRSSHVNSPG